ncbi:4Fe-4S dicluster domain-containing protein [Ellagibacter isourolithinifaciens]|uniref:4Fe-4S dicluster domain-containing protein n=1 Tax=Ellagibacter isourolithinifaciens TaxID=2137581 RepID=UPI0031B5916B
MRNGLLIDYEFCTGCQSCEIACKQEHGFGIGKWGIRVLDEGPWEIDEKTVNWNKIPTPTSLCDLCAERTAGGKLPTCVHHCLAGVMKFGPIDQLVEELDKKPNQVLSSPDHTPARRSDTHSSPHIAWESIPLRAPGDTLQRPEALIAPGRFMSR